MKTDLARRVKIEKESVNILKKKILLAKPSVLCITIVCRYTLSIYLRTLRKYFISIFIAFRTLEFASQNVDCYSIIQACFASTTLLNTLFFNKYLITHWKCSHKSKTFYKYVAAIYTSKNSLDFPIE